jgi:hypothetical protein
VTGLNSRGNPPSGSRDTVCRNPVRHDFPDPWNSSSRCSDAKVCTVSEYENQFIDLWAVAYRTALPVLCVEVI